MFGRRYLNTEGEVVQNLQNSTGSYGLVTAVA